MDDRARDAAEAKLLLPLVERFREIVDKYGIYISGWHKVLPAIHDDEWLVPVLLKAIDDPDALMAWKYGVDVEKYRQWKGRDTRCQAALYSGDRCEKDVYDGHPSEFEPDDGRFMFCDYHWRRVSVAKVRIWAKMATAGEDDEADTEAA
jgi:hypothetical protein